FGRTLGEHESQTARIGHMATMLFAMDAVTWLVAQMVDRAETDVRIEAAAAKIFCSEAAIAFLKDAMVLWGGRGYETADSKRKRGENAFPIEQLIRDAELYRIGEGATDILIPFIAREVLSPHLTRVKDALGDSFLGFKNWNEAVRTSAFYGRWYAERLLPLRHNDHNGHSNGHAQPRHLDFVESRARALARASLRE